MRIALLILALVNVSLLGYLVVAQHRPAGAPLIEKDDRSAVILAKLALFTEREEKQGATVRDLQKDLTRANKELTDLRQVLRTMEEMAQKSSEESQESAARLVKLADNLQQIEKKLDLPTTQGKQMTELVAELKKFNEQFKRVIDFASGRGGL